MNLHLLIHAPTAYGTSSDWLEETFGEINEKYVIEDQPDLFLAADLMEA